MLQATVKDFSTLLPRSQHELCVTTEVIITPKFMGSLYILVNQYLLNVAFRCMHTFPTGVYVVNPDILRMKPKVQHPIGF